eukprot:IDg8357t1
MSVGISRDLIVAFIVGTSASEVRRQARIIIGTLNFYWRHESALSDDHSIRHRTCCIMFYDNAPVLLYPKSSKHFCKTRVGFEYEAPL